ncbi:MAG TPA: tetratricopeptide repeat protein [Drouetiella sp.]
MATEQRKNNAPQTSHTQFFLLLTLCFTLCGAGACQEMSLGGGGDPKKWTDFVTRGNAEIKAGDYAAAEKDFQDADKKVTKEFGQEDPRRVTVLNYLAQMYREQQEYRKAALVYKDLITVQEKVDPKGPDLIAFKSQYEEIKKKIQEYGLDGEKTPKSEKKEVKKEAKGKEAKGKKH